MTVSSYSSSVLEAAVAGRPAAITAPQPFPPSVLAEWNALAPVLRTRDEFFEFLAQRGRSVDLRPLRQWADANLLAAGDPIANAADTLALACLGKNETPPPPSIRRSEQWNSWLSQRRRAVKAWARRRPPAAATPGHETDRFSSADIDERTSHWARILGRQPSGWAYDDAA
jgi:hypothetical protein